MSLLSSRRPVEVAPGVHQLQTIGTHVTAIVDSGVRPQ